MFQQMIEQFTTPKDTGIMVSKSDYELFCKEYVFEKLKGIAFGYAFCKRFGIQQYTISNMKNDLFVKQHIEKFYIK